MTSPAHDPEAPDGWPFRQAVVGTGVLAFGEIAARGFAFLAVAVLTRRLGPEGFGVVGFATAIAGYLAIAVNNGIGEMAARDVATRPSAVPAVYGGVLSVRLPLGCAAWLLMFTIAALLPLPLGTRLVVALTGLSFIAAAVDPTWSFKAVGRPLAAVAQQVGGQAAYAVGVLLLVPDAGALTRVPVVQFGAELVAALAGAWLLLRGQSPHLDWRLGRGLLSRARYLTASRLVRGLTVNFDVVLLGFVATAAQLGIYAAAYRVLFLLMAVGTAISGAFLPVLTRAAAADGAEFRRAASAAFTTALAVAMPLGLGGAIVAPEVLGLLFGAAYASGATAFRLLMLAGACFIVHSALMYAFIASERTRFLSGVHLMAAVVNVSLNIWGVPRYGIIAAAAATLAAEGLTAIVVVAALLRSPGLAARLPVGIIFAAAVMTLVLIEAGPETGLILRLFGGASVYVAALALLAGSQLRSVLRALLAAS